MGKLGISETRRVGGARHSMGDPRLLTLSVKGEGGRGKQRPLKGNRRTKSGSEGEIRHVR